MLAQLVKAVPKAAMQAPPKIKSRAPTAAKAQWMRGHRVEKVTEYTPQTPIFTTSFLSSLFFSPTNEQTYTLRWEKCQFFAPTPAGPYTKEIRKAPQKHLPLAIWLHVTGAVRESLSLLAENARACFQTFDILGKFILNSIVMLFDQKPNQILCYSLRYSKVSNIRAALRIYLMNEHKVCSDVLLQVVHADLVVTFLLSKVCNRCFLNDAYKHLFSRSINQLWIRACLCSFLYAHFKCRAFQ